MTDREAMKMALEALEVATTPLAADRQEVLKAQQALRQALAQPEQNSEAYGYAKRLAEAIWEKHYKKESPHWRPFHDVLGVLTQIDNMTCGLEKAQPEKAQPEQEPIAYWNGKDMFKRADEVQYVVNWTDYYHYPLYSEPRSCPTCESLARTVMMDQTSHDTAPPKREWVGLTDEERRHFNNRLSGSGVAEDIEAKLKEKNR